MKLAIDEEDEDGGKPKREFIPLDFGDQGAPQQQADALQQQLQQLEDEDDDEELDADKDGGAFKKNMNKKKSLLQLNAAAARSARNQHCR